MMDSSRQQQWQAILDKTRSLHDMVGKEQWEEVVSLESERQQMIRSFFETSIAEEDASVIAEGIREIMQSDDSLARMAAELKTGAVDKLTGISNVRKAVKAYEQFR